MNSEHRSAPGGRRRRLLVVVAATAGFGTVLIGAGLVLGGPALVPLVISGIVVGVAATTAVVIMADRRAMEQRLNRRLEAIESLVSTHRKDQSRHEYHHARALEELTDLAHSARADLEGLVWHQFPLEPPAPAGRPRVLFVTSNGNGMGHLSRCLSVLLAGADHFDAHLVTLSSAAGAVQEAGFPLTRYPSRTEGEDWATWHRGFSRFLTEHLRDRPADVIVFDGTWIFRGLTETARRMGIPLVWLARGTWKDTTDRTQLHQAGRYADAVIHPADLSPSAETARGIATVEQVGPIVLPQARAGLDRADACTGLGLDPERRYVLVQLGSGALSDVGSRAQAAIRAVHARGPDWDAVVLKYPFGQNPIENAERVRTISVYPLAKYLHAFDAAIIAAGYNSVHETLAAGLVPVIWPVVSSVTDDQEARARYVAERGLGVMVQEEADLGPALAHVADSDFARRAGTTAQQYLARDGAREVVQLLTELTAGRVVRRAR